MVLPKMTLASIFFLDNPQPTARDCKTLQLRVDKFMKRWVAIAPGSIHRVIVHLLSHMPTQLQRWGAYYWMYAYERSPPLILNLVVFIAYTYLQIHRCDTSHDKRKASH